MIKQSRYCDEVMQKDFNEEIVISKKDKENFENSTKCSQICGLDFLYDVGKRDHCHISGNIEVQHTETVISRSN